MRVRWHERAHVHDAADLTHDRHGPTDCTQLHHMLRLLLVRFHGRMLCGAVRSLAIPRKNQLPPRPKWLIVEDEIDEKFIKGGRGPGGQKINKTNSKVQLTHIPTGLVVTCQYSRSQESNRKKAREILALKLEDLANPLESRTAVVNTRKTLTKQSKTKKLNRKYKEIDERRLLERQQQELHERLLMEQFNENEIK